jgi:hypothetical protein
MRESVWARPPREAAHRIGHGQVGMHDIVLSALDQRPQLRRRSDSRISGFSPQEVDHDTAQPQQIFPTRFMRAATGAIHTHHIDLVTAFCELGGEGDHHRH